MGYIDCVFDGEIDSEASGNLLSKMDIEHFIHSLKQNPKENGVFNPWYDRDPENDSDGQGPKIRRRQLTAYLSERIGGCRTLLVGEALGYQGGHFTGIAMTSERILLGGQAGRGIFPRHVITSMEPQRTSSVKIKPLGFSEPTATIVWEYLANSGLDTRWFIIWNAFPWHPFNPEKGRLSNRTPTDAELAAGVGILEQLLSMTGEVKVIAVGEKSHTIMRQSGIEAIKVRHPANGGASKFRRQFQQTMTRKTSEKLYNQL